MADKYVRITGCEIGSDSASGKVFSCEIDDGRYWVPYSQCRKREIDPKPHESDVIEVTGWWAEQNDLEGDEV